MKIFTNVSVAIVVLISVLFLNLPGVANAATKSNTDDSTNLYVRSGQYVGSFDFHLFYEETYSDYSTTYWKVSEEYSYSTISDKSLSIAHEQYTRYYKDGSLQYTIDSFPWCSSYYSDPNKFTICKDKFLVNYPTKTKTRAEHTSNIVLPNNYNPSIYTNRTNLYY